MKSTSIKFLENFIKVILTRTMFVMIVMHEARAILKQRLMVWAETIRRSMSKGIPSFNMRLITIPPRFRTLARTLDLISVKMRRTVTEPPIGSVNCMNCFRSALT